MVTLCLYLFTKNVYLMFQLQLHLVVETLQLNARYQLLSWTY